MEGSNDTEGNTVGELSNLGGVRRLSVTVEDDQEDHEERLVEYLSPSLHEESENDVATTVKTIVTSASRSVGSSLQCLGRSHGVLSTDSDSVDEERDSVTNNPSLESRSPNRSQENDTDEHDEGVLDESELATDPVSFNSDEDLTNTARKHQ